jgi:hypothetical protein
LDLFLELDEEVGGVAEVFGVAMVVEEDFSCIGAFKW